MRLLLALPLLLAGCGAPDATNTNSVDINAAAVEAQSDIESYAANSTRSTPAPAPSPATTSPIVMPSPTAALPPMEQPPAPGTPGGLPDDRTPISEAPFTADSAQGAANVVQTYYALIGERKYRQAWALWGHDGKDSGMTAQAFAASFDKYREYHANVGAPGQADAGMSQRWVSVPVQVYGQLKTGKSFSMLGSMTLHRIVAGVGGPASQQRWHIRTTDLKPTP